MSRPACLFAIVLLLASVFPAGADKKEEEEKPDVVTHLLISTNQGGLDNITMQSMAACQAAAKEIYDKGDNYSGPSLYLYCVSVDGAVWAFDRWNRDD